jgi:hypothetical protein
LDAHAHTIAVLEPSTPPRATLPPTSLPARRLRPGVMAAVSHTERLAALHALQDTARAYDGITAKLVEVGGYPVVRVSPALGGGQANVGCAYAPRDDWWYAVIRPDGTSEWLMPTRQVARVMRVVADWLTRREQGND